MKVTFLLLVIVVLFCALVPVNAWQDGVDEPDETMDDARRWELVLGEAPWFRSPYFNDQQVIPPWVTNSEMARRYIFTEALRTYQ